VASGQDGPQPPETAAEQLQAADGLAVTLFAAEPEITNPTNIDVDDRGRVWMCDVVNYRGNQGKRPEGDRILVLEDTDADGRVDVTTVFFQGPEVDSAHGICVLGNRVIVSCSPNVWIFTDDDGDLRADRREVLFSKTGDPQNDHNIHAFVFGADGKLYFNYGNGGHSIHDRDGNLITDIDGRPVRADGKPYRQGMAFRANPDGTNIEVLGHNFRNPYELSVDSFGNVWQSDNDDDGNEGTRLNMILRHGNYGYTDERTGAGWQASRVGQHPDRAYRHWYQNDPGVVPNLRNCGSGSPAGIALYEGTLLPAPFRRAILHCEPGHNAVRAYQATANGAGYTTELVNLVTSRDDRWFRPVDVAVAPDGSLLVADWYDPGVGGHQQGDSNRGRIYRIAPPETPYRLPTFDFTTAAGSCRALANPNLCVRYRAWNALADMGTAAETELAKLWQDGDPLIRARASWLLMRLPDAGKKTIAAAVADDDPQVRILGLRGAEQSGVDLSAILDELVDDASPAVRRECAIALRRFQGDAMPPMWARLAAAYDGEDRWYLEALGIAAEGRWDDCLAAVEGLLQSPAGRDIVWRSRGTHTLAMLAAILGDPSTPIDELPRYLRAVELLDDAAKETQLTQLVRDVQSQPSGRRILLTRHLLARIDRDTARSQLRDAINQLAGELPDGAEYAEFVMRYGPDGSAHSDRMYALALGDLAGSSAGVRIVRHLLRGDQLELLRQTLADDTPERRTLVVMLAGAADRRANTLLLPFLRDASHDAELRRMAVQAVARNRDGARQLVELAEKNQLDEPTTIAVAYAMQLTPWKTLAERAARLHAEIDSAPAALLPVAEWMKLRGEAWRGQGLFAGKAKCSTCHRVGDEGTDIGPALTDIGAKLSRAGLFEALLFPSAAINHNYETYLAMRNDGTILTGIVISQTDESVTLKTETGIVHVIPRDELEELERQTVSLMPSNLHELVTPQELADVVAYLERLRSAP
jgi:putative membrane-bound dehydrogenase-like protein